MAPLLPHVPSSPTGSLLAVRNLGRRHPGTSGWLFRQIEFEIEPGDRLALVGPTGSGKSLILRAVALLDPVDQGEISWCGQSIADAAVPEFRGEVLYLQQRPSVIEGTVEYPRTVIIQIETKEAFRAWYDSPEYQAIVQMRLDSAPGSVIVVNGLRPTTPD